MASSIRGSHQVDGAFKKVMKRFEATKKKINSSAAKRMKLGEYEAATKWMEVGQAFEAFSKKFEVIQQEWDDLIVASEKALEGVESNAPKARKKLALNERSDIAREAADKAWKTMRSSAWISPQKLRIPALQALVKHGGTASLEEMLGDLHKYVLSEFPNSELTVNVPFNFTPWQKIVHKIHRHLEKQGWVEKRKDGQWRVTEKGRSAATA